MTETCDEEETRYYQNPRAHGAGGFHICEGTTGLLQPTPFTPLKIFEML